MTTTPHLIFFFFNAGEFVPPDSWGRTLPNVMHSVFEWLKTDQYTIGGVTGTLVDHFPGLMLVPAYPDDLTQLAGSVLAPGGPTEIFAEDEAFGEDAEGEVHSMAVAGIVVGQGSDAANRRYRDRLMNDVYKLLRRAAKDGIPLYEEATNTLLGEQVEVDRVRARQVPANALEIEADRFKFTVEAEVCVVVST